MVGRTPEYLGKKIQAAEMKLVVLYILAVPLVILGVHRHRRSCCRPPLQLARATPGRTA